MRRHEVTDRDWKLVDPHSLGRLRTGCDKSLFVKARFRRSRYDKTASSF